MREHPAPGHDRMPSMDHLDTEALEAGLADIRLSPDDGGTLDLIVRRPAEGEREELEAGTLDPAVGLVGDTWLARGSRRTEDGSSHPEMQVALVNSRLVGLVARKPQRWSLAGDQLYVDLDLGDANLPPGTRLTIGTAVIEITAQPHNGCAKFQRRFGADALAFVNSPVGKELHLRGIYAKILDPGEVHRGDTIRKL